MTFVGLQKVSTSNAMKSTLSCVIERSAQTCLVQHAESHGVLSITFKGGGCRVIYLKKKGQHAFLAYLFTKHMSFYMSLLSWCIVCMFFNDTCLRTTDEI